MLIQNTQGKEKKKSYNVVNSGFIISKKQATTKTTNHSDYSGVQWGTVDMEPVQDHSLGFALSLASCRTDLGVSKQASSQDTKEQEQIF